jgi:hypothetical protein
MNRENQIIEIGFYQLAKAGKIVCGDTFLSRKVADEDRFVAVLSDGLGSGIKASVLSTITASMTLNFRLRHEPLVDSARSIMDTLPIDSVRNISYSTFTIVDVDFEGEAMVVEYGNPSFFIERGGDLIVPPKTREEVVQSNHIKYINVSKFHLDDNDRLVLVSDGITQSGIGNADMPFGWGNEGLGSYVLEKLLTKQQTSASDLARLIVKKAEQNDILSLKDDASCAVLYRRKPRKMLVCSGPPYNEIKDAYLAEMVNNYEGIKVVCGGTTAKIISRELKKEIIEASLDCVTADVPPAAFMEGMSLVTEGILTLVKVAEILEIITNQEYTSTGPAAEIVKYLMNADIIEFIVGTRINIAHQDPALPIELEIRRNIIKRIVKILEDKFLKQVRIQYI